MHGWPGGARENSRAVCLAKRLVHVSNRRRVIITRLQLETCI
jgi:hypothetical protein